MFESLLEAAAVFFVTIGPLNNALIYSGLVKRAPAARARKMALRATLVATLILGVFALLGDDILRFLGIQLTSLEIAGGILLMLIGIRMVTADSLQEAYVESEEAASQRDVSIYPMAIPFIAGPDAMVSAVLLMSKAQGSFETQAGIFLVMLGMLAVTLVCLIFAQPMARLLGQHGGEVLSRILGVLLTALAVEFIVNGLAEAGLFKAALAS